MTSGTPTTRPHGVELARSLHPGEEEVEKEPKKWPKEGVSNLPGLVESGVCQGMKKAWSRPRRTRPMTTRGRVRWAGCKPEEHLLGAQSI